ncbi:MAG: dihydroorotate dehydrogenase-like protein [Bacteroidales bacterium]|nr:dihydroorotate dehydrogenase-like protein [Bacteroidales bacterium]MCF8404552.1 dihydroorotate dehydrogenase-like protein [Bacteroidales bacterium]
MVDLKTNYLGLSLKNPIIVGSSGLTDSSEKIKKLEDNGAAAVVLKSLFEEEITLEYEKVVAEEADKRYKDEFLDYLDYRIKEENITKYVKLIGDAKKAVDIPIIASVNCVSKHEWINFAREFQEAGADALEINLFALPTNMNKTPAEVEQLYFDIIEQIKSKLKIPVAMKISHYFSNLALMIQKLSESSLDGLVLFNRFYSPDFDIERLEVTSTNVLSHPDELTLSLRWMAIMSQRAKCDLAASTGIHDGTAVIKQLLAGANAVQVVSSVYANGPEKIQNMLKDIKKWMISKDYSKISDFRGKMSQDQSGNPSVYERVQFMKYFSDKDR